MLADDLWLPEEKGSRTAAPSPASFDSMSAGAAGNERRTDCAACGLSPAASPSMLVPSDGRPSNLAALDSAFGRDAPSGAAVGGAAAAGCWAASLAVCCAREWSEARAFSSSAAASTAAASACAVRVVNWAWWSGET